MKKSELRRMIREEVKSEFHQILPKLIRESIGSVLNKEMRRGRQAGRKTNRRAASKPGKSPESIDRTKLTELMGYGDMKPGADVASEQLREIAGVVMEGGLESKEVAMGQSHLRDYNEESVAHVESNALNEAEFVGGVDAGGSVPMELVKALGNHGKKILEATNNKSGWRPGMPR